MRRALLALPNKAACMLIAEQLHCSDASCRGVTGASEEQLRCATGFNVQEFLYSAISLYI